MSYRLLVLDSNAQKMSLPVLRKIAQLVKAGAAITGVKPTATPSLSDDQSEFNKLRNEIWESNNAKVFTAKDLKEVLKAIDVRPDFDSDSYRNRGTDAGGQSSEIKNPKSEILYVHRKLADGDIYWVNNRNNTNQSIQATFRVSGKIPQIWHPETGQTEPASYVIASGVTKVSLNLTPNDAVFVVFKKPATKTSVALAAKEEKEVMSIESPWTVAFQPDRGAPPSATFDRLTSYTENGDSGIRYFSGTATYTRTINIPAKYLSRGAQTWIDLGDVKNLAEVMVNGKSLGIVWKQPFRVDAGNALKPGENKLEIKVINLWVNRLIGDMQPGVTEKITFTSFQFYRADSKLQPSGLLGPVKVLSVNKE